MDRLAVGRIHIAEDLTGQKELQGLLMPTRRHGTACTQPDPRINDGSGQLAFKIDHLFGCKAEWPGQASEGYDYGGGSRSTQADNNEKLVQNRFFVMPKPITELSTTSRGATTVDRSSVKAAIRPCGAQN